MRSTVLLCRPTVATSTLAHRRFVPASGACATTRCCVFPEIHKIDLVCCALMPKLSCAHLDGLGDAVELVVNSGATPDEQRLRF